MTTNPPPDARNARIYVATANVAVMDILSGREHAGGGDPAGLVPVRLDGKTVRDADGNQRHLLAVLAGPARAPVIASASAPGGQPW